MNQYTLKSKFFLLEKNFIKKIIREKSFNEFVIKSNKISYYPEVSSFFLFFFYFYHFDFFN